MVTAPINIKDAAKLLSIEDKRDRMVFACGFLLGLRANSEMCQLKWGDLMGDDIEVYQPKTGKKRTVRVNSQLRAVITECYEGQPHGDYVFTGRRGQHGNRPLSNRGLNNIIRRNLAEQGVSVPGNDSSHFMRKTFGRTYFDANGGTVEALEWLRKYFGHASIHITMIYIGVDYEQQSKNVEKIRYA